MPDDPKVLAEGAEERFLLAYVSQDAKIVGIEHDTDADWHEVQRAHEVLRDRLNERLAERDKCPFKPATRPSPVPDVRGCDTMGADRFDEIAQGIEARSAEPASPFPSEG